MRFYLRLFVFLMPLLAGFDCVAQIGTKPEAVIAGFERAIDQGKFAAVERQLLDHARTDPQNVRALELVARMRLRQGRIDEARALYTRVLSIDPGFTLAKLYYSELLIQAGDRDAAKLVLGEIDSAKLSGPRHVLAFANALLMVGENGRAMSTVETLPLTIQQSDALPILLSASIALNDVERMDKVLGYAAAAAGRKPEAALSAASILIDAGMGSRAISLLEPLVRPNSRNVRALTLSARAYIQARNLDAARKYLDRAAMLEPRSVSVLLGQAIFENVQGRSLQALEILEKAVLIEPASGDVLEQMAITAIRVNKPRRALQAAEKLIALRPSDPSFLYLHGAAALQSGRLEAARGSLERFVRLRPADSRGCLALGLTLAARIDQIEAAREQLRHCVEIDPQNFEAKYQLGLSYKTQGDAAAATRYFEETVAVAPNYPVALRDLGKMYLQAGDEMKARVFLEKAVRLDAADADTHFQLSRLYNLIGERELARKHLESFQKLKGN